MKKQHDKNPKILFIHNALVSYRVPFFKLLDSRCNIQFIFTYVDASNIIYGEDYKKHIESMHLNNVSTCKGYFSNVSEAIPEGIPFGLLKHLFFTNYDIIVDNLQSIKVIFSFVASKIRRKPLLIWTEHWWWPFNSQLRNKLKFLIMKYILVGSDGVVVPGSKHKECIHDLGVDSQRIFIMPNASVIEQDHIRSDVVLRLKMMHNALDKEVILYVGRLIRLKGVDYLIKAFSMLKKKNKDVVLFIIGSGPEKENLVKLVNELSIANSVIFTDYIARWELPLFYSAAAVCVIPSITYTKKTDTWGLVLNEAMQFGKPVIATKAVGAAYDLIKNGKNGFLIPEKDEVSLYTSLKAIIENKNLRSQMGEESRKLIESHFQYENMVEGFCSAVNYIYEDAG